LRRELWGRERVMGGRELRSRKRVKGQGDLLLKLKKRNVLYSVWNLCLKGQIS